MAEFAASVRRVAGGGSALDPAVVSLLVGNRTDDPLAELTPREREVLQLMAEGRSNQGIAGRLVVTETRSKSTSATSSKLGIQTAAKTTGASSPYSRSSNHGTTRLDDPPRPPLPDGRNLAWSEYGDPAGEPLLCMQARRAAISRPQLSA